MEGEERDGDRDHHFAEWRLHADQVEQPDADVEKAQHREIVVLEVAEQQERAADAEDHENQSRRLLALGTDTVASPTAKATVATAISSSAKPMFQKA